jgi:DNA repair protein RecN (Recombination protein N)
MLRELRITNLALIEELSISFDEGLVVLTGETGAGKSIILQAIHLLSGGRAGTNWIRTGADAVTVEALFEFSHDHGGILDMISEQGVVVDDQLIIKRVLSGNGKSRYYINGSMVTGKVVGEVSENLVSVASQHDHQQLLKPGNHLDFIDSIGNLWPERSALNALFDTWKNLKNDFDDLQQQEKDKEQRRDLLFFQCREIEEATLYPGEDEELIQKKDKLKAAGDLLRLGQEAHELLTDTVIDNLAIVRKNLELMAAFDEGVAPLYENVAGQSYQLEDNVLELTNYVESIPTDTELLDEVTARIDLLQKLKRKYGAMLEDVIEHGVKARQELDSLDAMDEKLEAVKKELAKIENTLFEKAASLSKKRKTTAGQLTQKIINELHSLHFEQAEFEVNFKNDSGTFESIHKTGWDRPEFLFSANPGEPLKPLAAVASGGELSRLMLALKCILAQKDMVETVIFDEIDAGISGKTAEAVAKKIKELAAHHQVLCITHLPQIASFATEHFRVTKSVSGQRTRTEITHLSEELQVEEIARMLDGDSVTPKTMAYAKELIARNR